jgi:hypothetical protein
VTTVTYEKPAIASAVDAIGAIKSGTNKPDLMHVDSSLVSRETPSAYEADE